ncbi:hypothetical protein S245_022399 [Arachis hypogaea]
MHGEPFAVCGLYAFHMFKPFYEYDRKDGTSTTPGHSLWGGMVEILGHNRTVQVWAPADDRRVLLLLNLIGAAKS